MIESQGQGSKSKVNIQRVCA